MLPPWAMCMAERGTEGRPPDFVANSMKKGAHSFLPCFLIGNHYDLLLGGIAHPTAPLHTDPRTQEKKGQG